MTPDTSITIPAATGDLTSVPTDQLRRDLAGAIGITARAIATVAAIWTELERRGEDMSGYKFALRKYMRDVASGRLLPEAVAALAGQVRTLNLVATLPVADQRRLIEGEPIEIVTAAGETVCRPVTQMTWAEAARAIRDGAIRTVAEQRIALARSIRPRAGAARGRPRRITIADGIVHIGTVTVPLDSILAALRGAGFTLTEDANQ